MMYKIRLRKTDRLFRKYLLLTRPHVCARCGKVIPDNKIGSLHVSHYWSRSHEATRFDERNCDLLCFYCHNAWGHSEERDNYKKYKIAQLGEDEYNKLDILAHSHKKRDDKMDELVIKSMIAQAKGM